MRFPIVRVVAVLFALHATYAHAQQPAGAAVQFNGGPAHTGVYEGPGLDGYGGMLWRAELPGPVRTAAVVHEGRVYVGSAGGDLHSLDRWTGREHWRYQAAGAVHGPPAVWNGTVYTTDYHGTLHAVEARSGERRWTVETGPTMPWDWGHESGDLYLSGPVLAPVEGSMGLWFGAGDGRLYRVDPMDGRVLWSLPTEGRIRSTPAVADGVVVVGSADGSVYAADAATGELRWRFDTGGRELYSGDYGFDRKTVQSTPAIVDGVVYIGSRKGSVYAIDLGSGEQVWEASHVSSWINGSPAVADGRVFAGSSDGRFIQAVDARTGEELWRRDSGVTWSSPIVIGDAVIFSEVSGLIRAFDVASGETLWHTVLPSDTWASPVVQDGILFIGSDDGFYALRGADGSPLRKAVFWDSAYVPARWYLGHDVLADRARAHGYSGLDAEGLQRWLEERVRDREPSALIIALDRLPDAVKAGGSSSLFRRYLEAGGTVVWPALLPDLWPRDPETGEAGDYDALQYEAPGELLGMDATAATFDYLGAYATDEGLALGLPERLLAHYTVDPQSELEPLAIDEYGRFAAWRKPYGGPRGTGFVKLWPSRRAHPDIVPFITAAEYRPADPEMDDLPTEVRHGLILDDFVRDGMGALGVPGMAFSAVTTDDVLLERAWGVRDAAQGGAVDGATGFYIASSTKSFVGLLGALLDRRGWIDLDAPLTACLPGLDLGGAADPSAQTLRDMIRHTRGWDADPVITRTAYTDFVPPEELRELLAAVTVRENVGQFDYGNDGYVIADLCFRERLGIDWKELLETQVLIPAGMTRTTPFISKAAATGNFALPHLWDGSEYRLIPHKTDEIMHAAGGLVTTARDAGRWIRLHLGHGSLDGRRAFPADAVDEAVSRQTDAAVSFLDIQRVGYGLGWYDGRYRGDRLVHHFGGYTGAQAHISFMPDRDLGVAAFSNGGGGNAYLMPHLTALLWYDLAAGHGDTRARAALDSAIVDAGPRNARLDSMWNDVDRRTARNVDIPDAERYTGVYRTLGPGTVIVTRELDGGLYIDWGAREGPLLPTDEPGRFLADWEPGTSPDPIRFELPANGPARAFVWAGVRVPRITLDREGRDR